ncbi:MAG TPA: DUF4037 domain-containing protein [candidate division Zixibacteria bacterium]|nr:DUF4037 domain-containing protein [candidate division Zixibacteria bacterium]
MPSFIPGLELNRQFYFSHVKPILEKHYPKLKYSVARIGFGSDVLGFDTERSTDHDWGPRLELFLSENDFKKLKDEISNYFSKELPSKFLGYSTHFGEPDEKGVRVVEQITEGYVNHRIEIQTLDSFFNKILGINPNSELSELDWLSLPEQRLLSVTKGEVYHDGLMKLIEIRKKFSYYPEDIWYYLLAKQWDIIAEEMPFLGRSAELGDELNLELLVINQIKKIMKLCFLMEKSYAPYNKWFGIAFKNLNCSQQLTPIFKKIIWERDWDKKQEFLIEVYFNIATLHNKLKITNPIDIKIAPFHNRPYLIINTVDFANNIRTKIKSKILLDENFKIGSINQISNETFILDDLKLIKRFFSSFQEDFSRK